MSQRFSSESGKTRSAEAVPTTQSAAEHARHSAHFYSSDQRLMREIGEELASALSAGGSAVAVATPAHCEALDTYLRARGFDLRQAAARGRWVTVNAAEAVHQFLVEGWPDEGQFLRYFGSLMDRLGRAAGNDGEPEIAAFGEMVALLWEEGKTGAAVRVEELWNELARSRRFHLTCGWPLRFFTQDASGVVLQRICSEHNHVFPGHGYEAIGEEERRVEAVWQARGQVLREDIQQERRVQQGLEMRESELREFLERAVIGMHWLGPDGTILWANQTELELLRYRAAEYVGRRFAEFVPDGEKAAEVLEHLKEGKSLRGCELPMRCGDGAIRWIRLDANAWVEGGELAHARCFVLDITEKKRADEAQMLLAAIVASSEDAIVSKDLRGIVTSWNAAAERILGYTAEEMIGRPITTIIPPELQEDEPEILRKLAAGEHIEHFETVRVTKSGERLDVALTISPVRNPEGKIIGGAKILRDVTAQKKLEETLRTTERLASVGRLAATVAHEINNPLEAVTNLIYLARLEGTLPENVRRCLTAADEELQRVTHIARQTLGFYRETSEPVAIRVEDTLQEVLAIYDRRLRYKEATARQKVKPGLTVRTPAGEFKQVLSNLISNAIDASPVHGEIRISAWGARHPWTGTPGIRIAVADRGAGIPEVNLRRIFMPFFTTKRDVGTGLGLWITRDLLEKKGGMIRCRSRVAEGDGRRGSGTVMLLFLPTAEPVARR